MAVLAEDVIVGQSIKFPQNPTPLSVTETTTDTSGNVVLKAGAVVWTLPPTFDITASITSGGGVPSGGSSGQALVKASSSDFDVQWATITGGGGGGTGNVPAAGAINQVLAKASAADYDTHWVDDVDHGIPAAGTTGQALRKTSGTDYAVSWSAVHEIPVGGTSGQLLGKASGVDYDAGWVTPVATHSIPAAGTINQVLSKLSGSDYDVGWVTPTGGGSSLADTYGFLIPYSLGSGVILVGPYEQRVLTYPHNLIILGISVVAGYGHGPRGADALFDVYYGSGTTSIFTTHPANRPKIVAGQDETAAESVPDTTVLVAGDSLIPAVITRGSSGTEGDGMVMWFRVKWA